MNAIWSTANVTSNFNISKFSNSENDRTNGPPPKRTPSEEPEYARKGFGSKIRLNRESDSRSCLQVGLLYSTDL